MKAERIAAAILVAGFGAMLALNAPGQMTYDSVVQLADGRAGIYNSWHPPVMAFLLGLFDAVVPGTLLFLIFQSGLFLGALLLLLWCAPRSGWSVAVAVLVVLTPQWLLYQGYIWKDLLFADAAIAGFASLAMAAQKNLSWPWLVASALLLALAAATRQNGLVLLPVAALVLALIARRQNRGWLTGAGFLAVTLMMGIGVTLVLEARGDRGAGTQAQLKVGQAYDLAGAVWHDPSLVLPLAKRYPALDRAIRRQGATLYTPLHNDPLSDDPVYGAALDATPPGAVAASWRALVLDHPRLYLRTRLAVFSTVLLTPDAQNCHFAPVGVDGPPEELEALGLHARIRPQDRWLAGYAGAFFATPVFSHLGWALLAAVLLVVLLRRPTPADLAVAGLLAGALLFTLTFAVIAIACDYRYLIFLDLSVLAAALYVAGARKA